MKMAVSYRTYFRPKKKNLRSLYLILDRLEWGFRIWGLGVGSSAVLTPGSRSGIIFLMYFGSPTIFLRAYLGSEIREPGWGKNRIRYPVKTPWFRNTGWNGQCCGSGIRCLFDPGIQDG
jgi:hypothetical protein